MTLLRTLLASALAAALAFSASPALADDTTPDPVVIGITEPPTFWEAMSHDDTPDVRIPWWVKNVSWEVVDVARNQNVWGGYEQGRWYAVHAIADDGYTFVDDLGRPVRSVSFVHRFATIPAPAKATPGKAQPRASVSTTARPGRVRVVINGYSATSRYRVVVKVKGKPARVIRRGAVKAGQTVKISRSWRSGKPRVVRVVVNGKASRTKVPGRR